MRPAEAEEGFEGRADALHQEATRGVAAACCQNLVTPVGRRSKPTLGWVGTGWLAGPSDSRTPVPLPPS